MKLSDATPGLVVRNDKNGSYYKFERQEGERVRIWPLEHFPNGLLISKTAPTTVAASLEVSALSDWHDGDYRVAERVAPRVLARRREKYEAKLHLQRIALDKLEEEYGLLPVDGIGQESRGSHQNKIKAVQASIAAIERGLADVDPCDGSPAECVRETAMARPEFGVRDLVQLPSGLPALVTAIQNKGGKWMAQINTKDNTGAALVAAFPCDAMRPWSLSRVGTA